MGNAFPKIYLRDPTRPDLTNQLLLYYWTTRRLIKSPCSRDPLHTDLTRLVYTPFSLLTNL